MLIEDWPLPPDFLPLSCIVAIPTSCFMFPDPRRLSRSLTATMVSASVSLPAIALISSPLAPEEGRSNIRLGCQDLMLCGLALPPLQ
jgi:hypothetical protein